MKENGKKKEVSDELMEKFMEAKRVAILALNERLNKEDRNHNE